MAHLCDNHLDVCIKIIFLNAKFIIFSTKYLDVNANR